MFKDLIEFFSPIANILFPIKVGQEKHDKTNTSYNKPVLVSLVMVTIAAAIALVLSIVFTVGTISIGFSSDDVFQTYFENTPNVGVNWAQLVGNSDTEDPNLLVMFAALLVALCLIVWIWCFIFCIVSWEYRYRKIPFRACMIIGQMPFALFGIYCIYHNNIAIGVAACAWFTVILILALCAKWKKIEKVEISQAPWAHCLNPFANDT